MRRLKNPYFCMVSWGIFLASALSLGSCSSDETLEAVQGEAITFGDAFVDNSTRAIDPSYGTNKAVDQFKVWGTVNGNVGSALLYNGAGVELENGAYNCDQTEYWIPSATYNFVAIANATSLTPTSGIPTEISYTADGTSDLIHAEPVTVTTNASSIPTGVDDNGAVPFTFKHLLSKVHFTFTNTSTDTKGYYIIENIKINGFTAKGKYTIDSKTWSKDGKTTTEFTFGNATNATGATATSAQNIVNGTPVTSHFARLLIPGEQTLIISFDQEFWYDADGAGSGAAIKMTSSSLSKQLTYTFVANNSYNIAVELKAGAEITFVVGTLGEWDTNPDISIP